MQKLNTTEHPFVHSYQRSQAVTKEAFNALNKLENMNKPSAFVKGHLDQEIKEHQELERGEGNTIIIMTRCPEEEEQRNHKSDWRGRSNRKGNKDEHYQEVERRGKQNGRRYAASPLVPSQRYVDHIHTMFSEKQLTSVESMALQLYHRSSMGGTFPIKLQVLLKRAEEQNFQHIISWMPHGRAFMIHRPFQFQKEIMCEFSGQTKLSSFKRQLNLYDFKRITHGADSGAYYHEMFLRTKPLLAMKIHRRKIKGDVRVSTHIREEPEFYSMPFMAPIIDSSRHHAERMISDNRTAVVPVYSNMIRRGYETVLRDDPDQQQGGPRQENKITSSTSKNTRMMMVNGRGTYLGPRSAGTMMTFPSWSPSNELLMSEQEFYYCQPLHRHHHSTMPHQYYVQNNTTPLQMRNRLSCQNGIAYPVLLSPPVCGGPTITRANYC